MGHHLGAFSFLLKKSCVFNEIIVFCHCLFKALFLLRFLCVFEQVGTVKSIKNTAQGSKKLCVLKIKQNRSRARFGMNLGVILGVQLVTNVVFC